MWGRVREPVVSTVFAQWGAEIQRSEFEISPIATLMWECYESGGRWTHRVYRRAGGHCFERGTRIITIR
jgi:hypothetical protein